MVAWWPSLADAFVRILIFELVYIFSVVFFFRPLIALSARSLGLAGLLYSFCRFIGF